METTATAAPRPSPAWMARLGEGLLAAVFLYAAWSKLSDSATFTRLVAAYGLLPGGWIRPVARVLPWLEVVAALSLLAWRPNWRHAGAALGLALLLLFAGALGINLFRNRLVDCGCFEPRMRQAHETGLRDMGVALGRDLALAGVAAWLLLRRRPDQLREKPSSQAPDHPIRLLSE